jgi:RNA polymerase sigma-70 factor (ECF subfamily)
MIAEVPRLRRFAAAMIGDDEAADQLVQTTCRQALLEPASLPADGDFGVSLLALLYQRRRDARQQPGRPLASAITRRFDSVLFQPLQGADREEMREFADGIGSLAEDERAVLLLIALESLCYRDAALVMMMPTARVMARVAQARERLHQALKADTAGPQVAQGPDEAVWRPSERSAIDLDIHGYLDGEVSRQRIDEVENHLERERAAAERLVHYGVQGDLIRRLYGPLISRPLPLVLADRLQAVTNPRPRRAGRGRRKALGVLLLLIAALGGALWYFQPAWSERLPVILETWPLDRIAAFFERWRG